MFKFLIFILAIGLFTQTSFFKEHTARYVKDITAKIETMLETDSERAAKLQSKKSSKNWSSRSTPERTVEPVSRASHTTVSSEMSRMQNDLVSSFADFSKKY
jgi:hypothetical protein